jgi:geranylgeranylglycerol-phosphate geranylgeranyltransferase
VGAAALLQLARPLNCAIAGAATVAGYLLGGGGPWWQGAAAFAATAAVTGAGNAFNDARDASLDRAAHPRRPIPSGALSVRAALATSGWLAAAAIALAALAGGLLLAAFAAATLLLLLAYELRLKAWGLPGNVAVALLTGATFPFGATAAGLWWEAGAAAQAGAVAVGVAAGMAALANLARELAKDLQDLEADRGHRTTFPMRAGRGASVALAIAAGGAAALLPLLLGDAAALAFLLQPWALAAAGTALLLADAYVLGGAAAIRRSPAGGARALRIGMAWAVLAFLALGAAFSSPLPLP